MKGEKENEVEQRKIKGKYLRRICRDKRKAAIRKRTQQRKKVIEWSHARRCVAMQWSESDRS